jgi:hypothetical protein
MEYTSTLPFQVSVTEYAQVDINPEIVLELIHRHTTQGGNSNRDHHFIAEGFHNLFNCVIYVESNGMMILYDDFVTIGGKWSWYIITYYRSIFPEEPRITTVKVSVRITILRTKNSTKNLSEIRVAIKVSNQSAYY